MECLSLDHADMQEAHGCCDACGQWLSDVADRECPCSMCVEF